MISFKEIYYSDLDVSIDAFLLVGDIGGTNSNFGLFQYVNNKTNLLFSFHFKTKEITNFSQTVANLVTHIEKMIHIKIKHVCISAAGIVDPARTVCTLTNAPIIIDKNDLKQILQLECITLTNDFEIIGYGIEHLKPDSIVQVHNGASRERANKVFIGAGTGLGASIMYWDCGKKRYSTVASEGGHGDFGAQNTIECELVQFIKQTEHKSCNVSWEDILSGAGIKRLYRFFRSHNSASPSHWKLGNNGPEPDEIFNSKNLDAHAKDTYQLYTKLYARFAKNAALVSLSMGGLYIAGGIATHNIDLFKSDIFINEFLNCCKQQNLLKSIPIFVIADYNVSLYGAAEYMRLEDQCLRSCI